LGLTDARKDWGFEFGIQQLKQVYGLCDHVWKIQCRVAPMLKVTSKTSEINKCDRKFGFICKNKDQPRGEVCTDHEVRVLCWNEHCEAEEAEPTTSTPHFTPPFTTPNTTTVTNIKTTGMTVRFILACFFNGYAITFTLIIGFRVFR
jgi:hypothetical protein